MKSKLRQFCSVCIIAAILTTNFCSSAVAAFANDVINYEVNINFTPDNGQGQVEIGGSGTYNLSATTAQSDQLQDYNLRVDLPRTALEYIQGFVEDSSNENAVIYKSNLSDKLYLYVPSDQTESPYLYFTMEKGETFSTKVTFSMPEGTSSDYTVEVSENNLHATYSDGSAVSGNVVKRADNMTFFTHFDWNDVEKTVTPETVSATIAKKMSQDITYNVSVNRSRPQGREYIGMFTKNIVITDTIKLPEFAKFAAGGVLFQ